MFKKLTSILEDNTKRIRCAALLLICIAAMYTATAQKDPYLIRFGNNSAISYGRDGHYAVMFNGRQVISDAYARANGDRNFDTRTDNIGIHTSGKIQLAGMKCTVHTIWVSNHAMRQLFYVFPGKNYVLTQLILDGQGASNYMAPLITDRVLFQQSGDNRVLYVPFDNDMWARYNAAPMKEAAFNSSEVTAIYNTDNNNGIVIGSLEQDNWKSGIRIKGGSAETLNSLELYAGMSDSVVTHDRIAHGKILPGTDGQVKSPLMLIGSFADWRDGMETFAKLNAVLQPKQIFSWTKPTPVGWNSWGVLQDKITFEKAMKVVGFFGDSLTAFRSEDNSLFIDLDAFWDNMTPGGIDGDVSKLQTFVDRCKQKGLKPGIYWTPFADWGKSDRNVEGATGYSYPETWTKQNSRMLDIDGGRAMDPTHPATKQRIVHTIHKMKAMGFEMIKIDFLGHGAQEADRFYDSSVTTGMQAFRQGMSFLDSVLGKQMLVYAAISPNMATARYVHARRIACDAFSSLEHTEYTLNSTGYGWWQSFIYNYMDADHVVFAKEEDGVNRARLAAALVTGTLFTGDDYSITGKWTNSAKLLLQNKDLLAVIRDGKSFRPVYANTGDRGVSLFIKTTGDAVYIAHFNYTDQPQSFTLPPGPLKGMGKQPAIRELFSGQSVNGGLTLEINTPPQDVRLYRLVRQR